MARVAPAARAVEHQPLVDRAERLFRFARLPPGRAERAGEDLRRGRGDRARPVGGIGEHRLHPRTARKGDLAPDHRAEPIVAAADGGGDHFRSDEAGRTDQSQPHGVRHSAILRAKCR